MPFKIPVRKWSNIAPTSYHGHIFEALSADPDCLRQCAYPMVLKKNDDSTGYRIIADYISSMTDGHAQRLHQQLFSSY